jgi:putative ABC transport system permease protein
MLGLVGTLAGVALSLAGIFAINVWQPTFDFGMQKGLVMAPAIAAGDVLTIAVLVLVVAVIASLQPAWKASRMDPIGALRHV